MALRFRVCQPCCTSTKPTGLVQIIVFSCFSKTPACTVTFTGPNGTYTCSVPAGTETSPGLGTTVVAPYCKVPQGAYTATISGLDGPYGSPGAKAVTVGPAVTTVSFSGPDVPDGFHCCEVGDEMLVLPDTLYLTAEWCGWSNGVYGPQPYSAPLLSGGGTLGDGRPRSCGWNEGGDPAIYYLGGGLWSLTTGAGCPPSDYLNQVPTNATAYATGPAQLPIALTFTDLRCYYAPGYGGGSKPANQDCGGYLVGMILPAEVSS